MPLHRAEQTTETIIQIEHNIVKNPNWPGANQLAIYKRGRGFELGATEKQIQVVARAGFEPGTAGLRVQHSDHSATLPRVNKSHLFLFFYIFVPNPGEIYCWFSHDVTKIQTSKPLILLIFYFHAV